MKPYYWDQDAPDADDLILQEAIASNIVPAGCLLGGPMVMAIGHEIDPCAVCAMPDRDKCGGRPKKYELGDSQAVTRSDVREALSASQPTDAGARKVQRATFRRKLEAMMEEQENERRRQSWKP